MSERFIFFYTRFNIMYSMPPGAIYIGFGINRLYILPERFIFFYNRINIMYFMSGGTISKFRRTNIV